MNPINPRFATTLAHQRIQEHLDQAAAHQVASKGSRLSLRALFPVRVTTRQGRPARLGAWIPGRAY